MTALREAMSLRVSDTPRTRTDHRTIVGVLPRPRNRLIFDLLHGIAGDEERVIEEARRHHMDLSQPRAVVLIDASDYVLGPAANHGADVATGARVRAREVVATVVSFFMLP